MLTDDEKRLVLISLLNSAYDTENISNLNVMICDVSVKLAQEWKIDLHEVSQLVADCRNVSQ